MRIKLFIDSLTTGGAQRQLVGLAKLLKDKGHEVSVVLYYDIPFYSYVLTENNIPFKVLFTGNNPIKRILKFYNYLKAEKPEWVISYLKTPNVIACIVKLLGGDFKLIVSERNTTQLYGIKEKIIFFFYHWADYIVPNSFSETSFLKTVCPWMEKKLVTITNFTDLRKFNTVDHKRRNIPLIIVAATVMDSKNVMAMIRAVKILKDRGVNVKVDWYGLLENTENTTIKNYQNKCFNLINKYELNDSFFLIKKTNKIDLKYKEADYFCLPSFYEGTPNVICEAISTGLPVMCSDICDNRIYVHEGINGTLFNPKDSEDIANKMEKLLKQDEMQYQQFRLASRKIAEEKLSEDIFVDKYLQILKK